MPSSRTYAREGGREIRDPAAERTALTPTAFILAQVSVGIKNKR